MRDLEEVSLEFDVGAVREVLSELPVSLAVLYGSRARGGATETSDFDIAVRFDESLDSTQRTRARLSLIERLSTTLGTNDIDVVPLERLPDTLRREVLEDGVVLQGSPDWIGSVSLENRGHEERVAAFDEMLSTLDQVV
jgi:predicted nucleotidyltransferase